MAPVPDDPTRPADVEPPAGGGSADDATDTDVASTLPLRADPQEAEFAEALLLRLAGRGDPHERYVTREEVGQGGQGIVLRVWDEDLHRHLAMKVMLGSEDGSSADSSPRSLARFLDEAQVTGQLDHPGIVPVHELGLDASGRIYFTMKLVSGRDLRKIFGLVREGEEGWNLTRALGVLLKVCEAMAYAHDKGVIHRDLKPSNIMVGRFGEVFVMDWGLARVEGRDDGRDLRIRKDTARTTLVRTERAQASPDSPLITMDGDVVGTPAYMCPEQARGDVQAMGPHSDVYSVGAMLYDLLTGTMPYAKRGVRVNNYAIWSRVQEGPPLPVETLVDDVPPELAAICEKAMARPIEDRYPDMSALAEDLRAWLEGRVVHAYETGAVAELRKWIVRNKPLAGSLAAAVLALVAGLAVSWTFYVEAEQLAGVAEENAIKAQGRADELAALLRLSDAHRLRMLRERADVLWPPHPEQIEAYDAWLEDVADLRRRLDVHRATLERMSAEPAATTEDAWLRDLLAELVPGMEDLIDDQEGMVGDVRKRRAIASAIGEATVTGARIAEVWEQAIDAVVASPLYGGLVIEPQIGLVPLGPDPGSGLWEFAHVLSGAVPRRLSNGTLDVDPDNGVVFVLLPGGTTWHGSQTDDSQAPYYDPQAQDGEGPLREVTIEPFFFSKYEMTQGQWLRLATENPSWNRATMEIGGRRTTLAHPVEQVSWHDCHRLLTQWGMTLPTEVQWEYAVRGGTTTPWWTGDDPRSLEGAENLSDRYRSEHDGPANQPYELWLDDGYSQHARVGLYRPNAFGLHDMCGNLSEWCANEFIADGRKVQRGDGGDLTGQRAVRGGGFWSVAGAARSSYRSRSVPDNRDLGLGVRPARALDR